MSGTTTVQAVKVDFLPLEYKQQRERHRSRLRACVLGSIVTLGLLGTELLQQSRYWQLRKAVADCQEAYQAAVRTQQEIKQLEKQLADVRAEADLYTFLRHPWPRTQIFSAVLLHLPAEVAIDQLRVLQTKPGQQQASFSQEQSEQTQTSSSSPALQDLGQLKQEAEQRETVVTIVGRTKDLSALHRYLAQLGRQQLFNTCELETVESEDANGLIARFTASLKVIAPPGLEGALPADALYVNCEALLDDQEGKVYVAGDTNLPDGSRLGIVLYEADFGGKADDSTAAASELPGYRVAVRSTVTVSKHGFSAELSLPEDTLARLSKPLEMPERHRPQNDPLKMVALRTNGQDNDGPEQSSQQQPEVSLPVAPVFASAKGLPMARLICRVVYLPGQQTDASEKIRPLHGASSNRSDYVLEVYKPVID